MAARGLAYATVTIFLNLVSDYMYVMENSLCYTVICNVFYIGCK